MLYNTPETGMTDFYDEVTDLFTFRFRLIFLVPYRKCITQWEEKYELLTNFYAPNTRSSATLMSTPPI